jgi:hypothetical protein
MHRSRVAAGTSVRRSSSRLAANSAAKDCARAEVYMPVICSPAITRNDFESFRRLINKDFPYTSNT